MPPLSAIPPWSTDGTPDSPPLPLGGLAYDTTKLPPPTKEYVTWIDVMGFRSTLTKRSINVAVNHIMKLQAAAILAVESEPKQRVRLYPMNDGVFSTSLYKGTTVNYIHRVFKWMAEHFLLDGQQDYHFIIRGGLAYGPVIHGEDAPTVNQTLNNAASTCQRIVLGHPVVWSYEVENVAPPFGIAVHESARAFGRDGTYTFSGPTWPWWKDYGNQRLDTGVAAALKPEVLGELARRASVSEMTGYPRSSVERHSALVEQYLP